MILAMKLTDKRCWKFEVIQTRQALWQKIAQCLVSYEG